MRFEFEFEFEFDSEFELCIASSAVSEGGGEIEGHAQIPYIMRCRKPLLSVVTS